MGEQFGQAARLISIAQLDFGLRSQLDHEPSFAGAAHSDTSNREIGNT
jgi:hypothetical protein